MWTVIIFFMFLVDLLPTSVTLADMYDGSHRITFFSVDFMPSDTWYIFQPMT